MKFIQYGLRRTGTNWFEQLLLKNFGINFENRNKERTSILHKHTINHTRFDSLTGFNTKVCDQLVSTNKIVYMIHVKHPYSWWISRKKWFAKCKKTVDIKKSISRYNDFYKTWMRFCDEQVNADGNSCIKFIKYEDLLKNYSKILNEIHTEYKLIQISKPLTSVYQNINRVPQSKLFNDERKRYYLNDKYVSELTKEEKVFINDNIDKDVISYFQYILQ